MNKTDQPTGVLYIVPTPIGNLEDITLRAIRILKEVDFIAAEDTRHTKKLLNHFGIKTKLISYYREKETERTLTILKKLHEGLNIALVSDAGTPGISDPGAVVVQKAHEEEIKVVPLPGASAITTALSASGIVEPGFLFLGFPACKKGQRKKQITTIKNSHYPVVFYESPHRIGGLLRDCLEILGDREVFWARELTKTYEDLQKAKVSQLLQNIKNTKVRGEFVITILPELQEEVKGENIEEMLIWYRDESGLSLKDASKKLAADLGFSRSSIYQQALSIWNKK